MTDTPTALRLAREALATAKRVAEEARQEWDAAPEGMKAGKLLIALSGCLPGYRADIDQMHAALAALDALPLSDDGLVKRLRDVRDHNWLISFLGHTSDTAGEAADRIEADAATIAVLTARLAEAERHLALVLDDDAEATVEVDRRRAARAFLSRETASGEPVAYLKTWVEDGDPHRRVDLNPKCEPWLERREPRIQPLYLAASPAPDPVGEIVKETEPGLAFTPDFVAEIGGQEKKDG